MSRGVFSSCYGAVLRLQPLPAVVLLAVLATWFAQTHALAIEDQLRAIPVRNTDSDSIVKVLQQIFNDKDVRLASNTRTNTILVQADARRLEQIQQFVAKLDRRLDLPGRHTTRRFVEANVNVHVLEDGAVEIRAPTNADYWVRSAPRRQGVRVRKGVPLILLDASDRQSQAELQQEINRLSEHLRAAEALSRQHRHKRTEFDKETFAKAAKRSSAIRAGISERSRRLQQLKAAQTFVITAPIDGVVTFVAEFEEHGLDGRPLEPDQLLLRIEPK